MTSGCHHGRRLIYECVSFVETQVSNGVLPYKAYKRCAKKFSNNRYNIRRWYRFYVEWGELKIDLNKKLRKYRVLAIVKDGHVNDLKRILEEHPEYYLDEFAAELASVTGMFYSISTISRVLRNELHYSLQVCYHKAIQQDAVRRDAYKIALAELMYAKDARMVIFIDETHKDKSASRRRRAWGRRNAGGVALDKWFQDTVRYTMIIATDIDGFVDETCNLYLRSEEGNEGASGTVGTELFVEWVQYFLCPCLGNYANGEPRSIVVMDNASTHHCNEVEYFICQTGALLLYTAPYSPDLNPIEKMFNIYKTYLKRHEDEFSVDYRKIHLEALESATKDNAIEEFRHCGVPGSTDVLTSEEIRVNNEEDDALLFLGGFIPFIL